jgi:hypothetical protein
MDVGGCEEPVHSIALAQKQFDWQQEVRLTEQHKRANHIFTEWLGGLIMHAS